MDASARRWHRVSTAAASGDSTIKEISLDQIAWFIKFAGAILSVLMLFGQGRRNGWI